MKQISVRPMVLLAALSLVLPQAVWAASFKEVRDRVYAKPLSKLPKEPGLSPLVFIQAVTTKTGELVSRVKGTLGDSSDFKKSETKVLHPMGVCAEADWVIDSPSPATGLLSSGTAVKAIVRFSAADTQTQFSPTKNRMFGMAIKLFPATNETESTETSNLFTLDQAGLTGSVRERFLGDGPSQRTYFENQARGSGFLAETLEKLFKNFDSNPSVRPLYPLTEVNSNGTPVATAVTPSMVRLTPRIKVAPKFAKDFRDEIRAYRAGEIRFEIALPVQDGNVPVGKQLKIGQLIVGQPVVSTVCDHELHFRHHPTR